MNPVFLYGLSGVSVVVGVAGYLNGTRKVSRVRDTEKKNARLKEENERLIEQGKASGLADAQRVRELEEETERLSGINKALSERAEALSQREQALLGDIK